MMERAMASSVMALLTLTLLATRHMKRKERLLDSAKETATGACRIKHPDQGELSEQKIRRQGEDNVEWTAGQFVQT
jgi:prophage DNA circulation protein